MAAGLLGSLVAPVAARSDDDLPRIVTLEENGRFWRPVDDLPAGAATHAAAATTTHDKQT